jgi:alkylation response protein AidB-like acyl-CoA dehydrogenase
MDFDDTPAEAAFRAEVRSWLDAHAKRRSVQAAGVLRSHVADDLGQEEHVRACRDWQRTLCRGGWAGITWPTEFGGRGGTAVDQMIFTQEQASYDVHVGALVVGLGMVGPTLMRWGRPEQQHRHLGPMLQGDEMWCQLFSEPGAGSDLPSLTTRAELDVDEYVVNGQKVWTTLAQYSDWAILLARTDRNSSGRKGISYFLVDMRTPGIEVRPLRQISGVSHFNEVFLTDVRVPVANLVGDVGEGWPVARTTMASERMAIGAGGGTTFEDVAALIRSLGGVQQSVCRQAVASAYIHFELLRFLRLRVQTALSQGRSPGAEGSLLKLAFSRHAARLGDLGLELLGAEGLVLDDGRPEAAFWRERFLNQWAMRIGGGTDEIQRNQISEQTLGLPRDPLGKLSAEPR